MNVMRFMALPVGQGTGTLLQVVENPGTAAERPIESVLIDLGSRKWLPAHTGYVSRDFVIEQLRKMAAPTLDGVFISHPDLDHYNLILDVLKAFKKPSANAPASDTLTLKDVWYGGKERDYTKRNVNALRLFKSWGEDPAAVLHALGPDAWSPTEPIYASPNGLHIWVMIGNTVMERAGNFGHNRMATEGYPLNTASLVLAVSYGSARRLWIVATGDATGLTIARCNDVLAQSPAWQSIAPVLCMAVPHHGSKRTTYDLLGATAGGLEDEETVAQDNVDRFVDTLEPFSLSISAGEVEDWKQPAARVIKDFSTHVTTERMFQDPALSDNQHFYTAYYKRDELQIDGSAMDDDAATSWPPQKGWWMVRSDRAIFTNDYFDFFGHQGEPVPLIDVATGSVRFDEDGRSYVPAPAWVTGWAWQIAADGRTWRFFQVCDIRKEADRSALERIYGPLPPGRFAFVAGAPPRPEPEARTVRPPVPLGVAASRSPGDRRPRTRRPRQLP